MAKKTARTERAAAAYASARVRGALRVDTLMLDAAGQPIGEYIDE